MPLTLKNRAYQQLLRKVSVGELAPGAQLKSAELAAGMGMSMIPVREAIQQLASEGVVEYRPHTGAFVRKLDATECEELLRLRAGLDCMAAPEAALRATSEHLRGMEAACNELREIAAEAQTLGAGVSVEHALRMWVRVSVPDYALHMWIIRAAGNRYLLSTYQQNQLISRVARGAPVQLPPNLPHMLAWMYLGHARIFHAIRRRDPELALKRMQFHWGVQDSIDPTKPFERWPGYTQVTLSAEHNWIYRRIEELEQNLRD